MKLDIQALSRALIKNMTKIAENANSLEGKDIGKTIESAVDKLLDDYKKEGGDLDENGDEIDLENVVIIKENE